MRQVLREEKKYLIQKDEYLKKSYLLSQIMMQDEHNGIHGYTIRSLYFDTPYDDDFHDKQSGVEIRRKVRLRCYDPNADYAMLELKQKQGNQQLKRSLKVSKKDALELIQGNYSCLLTYKDNFAIEMYALMQCNFYRPKTIVEYERKAFIAKENKIRITFDHHIQSTESNLNLFDEHLNMNPVFDDSMTVLEVKYNGFLLSYLKELINSINKSEISVSKYILARQNSYQTHM